MGREIDIKRWLQTFLDEKGIDIQTTIEVEGEKMGINFIPVGVICEHICITTKKEQKLIKETLCKIDFANGDIMHFFKHLAKAIAV